MEADRTEMHDLAGKMPEIVKQMEEKYNAWVKRYDVSTRVRTNKLKEEED